MSTQHLSDRRKFIGNVSLLAGGALLTPGIMAATPRKKYTVGEIMDLFLKEVPGAPFPNTVDTLKSGSRDNEVSGIVTTMFATIPVIHAAISHGANFIIAHEPTFYNHLDNTDWLSNDEVFRYKMDLLNKNKITVWRNHDYIHTHRPDGVMHGVLEKLGWRQNVEKDGRMIRIPATPLNNIISHCKDKLGVSMVRYIGDLQESCSTILLMPGASGGQSHIRGLGQYRPDLIIVGELQEWETAEYVRDARAAGKKLSLVVLGHSDSEEPGSVYLADWLKEKTPGVKVFHIPSGNPFMFK